MSASAGQGPAGRRVATQRDAGRIGTAPQEGDVTEMLATGKIALGDLGGDGSFPKAMETDGDDTVQAYDRAADHGAARAAAKAFFETARAAGRRHREWMDRTAHAL